MALAEMTTPDLAGLCERLRASWSARGWVAAKKIDAMIHLEREAAAAIERLAAENAAMREALERIRSEADTTRFIEVPRRNLDRCADIAHETLAALQQAGEVG